MLSNENVFSCLRISHLSRLAPNDVQSADPRKGDSLVSGLAIGDLLQCIQQKMHFLLSYADVERQFPDQPAFGVGITFHLARFLKIGYYLLQMQVVCHIFGRRGLLLIGTEFAEFILACAS